MRRNIIEGGGNHRLKDHAIAFGHFEQTIELVLRCALPNFRFGSIAAELFSPNADPCPLIVQ